LLSWRLKRGGGVTGNIGKKTRSKVGQGERRNDSLIFNLKVGESLRLGVSQECLTKKEKLKKESRIGKQK